MGTSIVFETHARTEDNEAGRATGWLPGALADIGRQDAAEMGARRRGDGLAAVFSSDLARATETVQLAFAESPIPVLLDWRLRECDYGSLNGAPHHFVHRRRSEFVSVAYPGGESWEQAIARVGRFLADLPTRWDGRRVLIVGHLATLWGLEHFVAGRPLAALVGAEFVWRPGWEFHLP